MNMRKRKLAKETGKTKEHRIEVAEEGAIVRCKWVNTDPLYIAYHDTEWGRPLFNSVSLFEMLCLGGQQAGLSWITILKKREHYKLLFHNFDPYEISKLNANDVDSFLCDPGIIRNRIKLESIIQNSKCYLKMEEMGIDFSKFVWSFVNGTPIVNKWSKYEDIPTQSEASTALSKALKKYGFKFVGSTICYAFMQSCGLINDHLVSCISYRNCQ